MYYTVYAFLAIIIIIIINPPPQTKQNNNNNNNNNKTGATLALLWNVYAWVKARKRLAGTDHAGAGEMKACPCYTDSSIMTCNEFEDAQEQAPTQV